MTNVSIFFVAASNCLRNAYVSFICLLIVMSVFCSAHELTRLFVYSISHASIISILCQYFLVIYCCKVFLDQTLYITNVCIHVVIRRSIEVALLNNFRTES